MIRASVLSGVLLPLVAAAAFAAPPPAAPSGEPYQLSPGMLLQQTLVTSGTMTNRIDRLADKGFVRREPDPSDRRGVLVCLTPEGLDHVDGALSDLLAHEQKLLAGLTEDQRDSLAHLLRELVFPFDNPERAD